jgi:hypothetical protein
MSSLLLSSPIVLLPFVYYPREIHEFRLVSKFPILLSEATAWQLAKLSQRVCVAASLKLRGKPPMDQRAGSALYEGIVFCPRIDMNSTKQALATTRRGKGIPSI